MQSTVGLENLDVNSFRTSLRALREIERKIIEAERPRARTVAGLNDELIALRLDAAKGYLDLGMVWQAGDHYLIAAGRQGDDLGSDRPLHTSAGEMYDRLSEAFLTTANTVDVINLVRERRTQGSYLEAAQAGRWVANQLIGQGRFASAGHFLKRAVVDMRRVGDEGALRDYEERLETLESVEALVLEHVAAVNELMIGGATLVA